MRKREPKIWIMALGGLLFLLLAGCAAHIGKSVKVSEQQRAKYDVLSVTDAVIALEKRLAAAKQANMPFFAPNYFIEASEILSETQKTSTKKPKTELVSEVARGDAILDKGEAMMVVVQNRFVREIELKGLLDKVNAPGIYPKEYEKIIGELASLIEKVELEKSDKIDRDQGALITAMQALDIKTVQHIALHESDVINMETKSKNGEKQAPATLAIALDAYKYAENRIAQAPHDAAPVQRASEEALFAARHARHVSEQALTLQNQFKVSAEVIVLSQEKYLFDIATALGQRDLRDQPLDKQVVALVLAINRLMQATQAKPLAESDKSQELDKKLKAVNDALEQANGLLAAQAAQIKMLNITITNLESQAKPLVEPKAAGGGVSNAPR